MPLLIESLEDRLKVVMGDLTLQNAALQTKLDEVAKANSDLEDRNKRLHSKLEEMERASPKADDTVPMPGEQLAQVNPDVPRFDAKPVGRKQREKQA